MSWFSGGDQLTTMLFTSGRTCKEPGTSGTRDSKYHTWSTLINETVSLQSQENSNGLITVFTIQITLEGLGSHPVRCRAWAVHGYGWHTHRVLCATLQPWKTQKAPLTVCLSWSCKSSQETKAQTTFIERGGRRPSGMLSVGLDKWD